MNKSTLRQADLPSACLHAEINPKSKPVHFLPPPGQYELKHDEDGDESAFVLLRNWYGTIDGALLHEEHTVKWMSSTGFTQNVQDPCLFHRRTLTVVICSDDPLCHTTSPQEQTLFESQLNDKWGSVECHDADMHLGITMTQDKEAGTTSLSMERCLENLYEKCKEHLPLHSKAIPAPASRASDESLQPKTDEQPLDQKQCPYRSLLGALLHCQAIMAHCALAISQHARVQSNPEQSPPLATANGDRSTHDV